MSMPIIERPDNPVDRGQSVSDLIESIALMETGLSHVINAEGEKLQKVLQTDSLTIDEIIGINDSIAKTINNVSKLEMLLQNKLDIVIDLDEPSITDENAYMFASAETGPGPVARLPDHQILYNFTADFLSNQFTVTVPGTYLFFYRKSRGELIAPMVGVFVNNTLIPASWLNSTYFSNDNSSSFIYHLNAGDSVSIAGDAGSAPTIQIDGIRAFLCVVKIGP